MVIDMAEMQHRAATTSTALKHVLDAYCRKHWNIDDADPLEKESFFEIVGHSAQVLNALVAVSKDGFSINPADHQSLLMEGQVLCIHIRDELEGVLQ